MTCLIHSGHAKTSFMIGSGNVPGRIIVPNPSPPPTSTPLPSINSLTVAAATHASSISLGPGLEAEKSASMRTLELPWRHAYDAEGNTSKTVAWPSSIEKSLKPSFIHSGAAFSIGVHWGLARWCALITISQCRPFPLCAFRGVHFRLIQEYQECVLIG